MYNKNMDKGKLLRIFLVNGNIHEIPDVVRLYVDTAGTLIVCRHGFHDREFPRQDWDSFVYNPAI